MGYIKNSAQHLYTNSFLNMKGGLLMGISFKKRTLMLLLIIVNIFLFVSYQNRASALNQNTISTLEEGQLIALMFLQEIEGHNVEITDLFWTIPNEEEYLESLRDLYLGHRGYSEEWWLENLERLREQYFMELEYREKDNGYWESWFLFSTPYSSERTVFTNIRVSSRTGAVYWIDYNFARSFRAHRFEAPLFQIAIRLFRTGAWNFFIYPYL